MHASRVLTGSFDRQARVRPGKDAAFEVPYVTPAGVLETTGKGRSAMPR